MKFMLMMNVPHSTGEYQINQWTPEAFNAHIRFMRDLNRDLMKAGEFVEAHGLTPPGQAKIVRYGKGGAPVVTDGPFAETKEFLAGFWIIDVEAGACLRDRRQGLIGARARWQATDARRAARSGPVGELIPLDEQDRSLWDPSLIKEGTELVSNAMAKGQIGPYQLQAAIAALHDEAPTTAQTDWAQIDALYGLLERMSDNPMVALNRAVATAMVQGPDAGLRVIEKIAQDERLKGHYRIDAVRAHLHERAGRRELALEHYQRAAEGTASLPERNYLLSKAVRLASQRD